MRTLCALFLGSALLAQTTRATAADAPATAPATAPTTAATTRPAATPAATGSAEALALAAKVVAHAGGADGWAKVENLAFTFGGSRRWFWDRKAAKVRIENLRPPPPAGNRARHWTVLVTDLTTRKSVFDPKRQNPLMPAISGYDWWVNDAWWLLAPLKVLDPGVRLELEPPGAEDPAIRRLRLRLGEAGLAPHPEYVLHVDERNGRIRRWDCVERAGAEPVSWRFEDWRQLGPLLLALGHPDVAGKRDIVLSDVVVNGTPPKDVWTNPEPILGPAK